MTSGRIADFVAIDRVLPTHFWVIWPILQSMLHDPDLVVAAGNGWWTKATSIIAIQRASTEAWARLFDKPLVMSFNI